MYRKSIKSGIDWKHRWFQLLIKIERVQTSGDELQLIEKLSCSKKPFVLAFANAHAMNSLAASRFFFESIFSADMVLRDGSGMAALFNLLQMPPGLNLNGTDLIPKLVHQFNGRSIALFGTQNPYLNRGLQVVEQELAPQSNCITEHGFKDVGIYVALAKTHRPALIVLGMGMPRQEEVAAALRLALTFPCLIVCGGAIIDFLGGRTPRAPSWIRKTGFEWMFRLLMEPRRLFKRYVIGNPLFLIRALWLVSWHRRWK
jgi:N-acetylglucosaminyldiphosphoundecaprenol N-acetyl-beta-D-mannosaminyltransferase